MTKDDERDARRKLRILEHARKTGHVAKTCRYFGIDRASGTKRPGRSCTIYRYDGFAVDVVRGPASDLEADDPAHGRGLRHHHQGHVNRFGHRHFRVGAGGRKCNPAPPPRAYIDLRHDGTDIFCLLLPGAAPGALGRNQVRRRAPAFLSFIQKILFIIA